MKRELPMNVYQNRGRYMATVTHEGKKVYLGMFDTPEEASEKVKLFREHYPKKKTAWQPGDAL